MSYVPRLDSFELNYLIRGFSMRSTDGTSGFRARFVAVFIVMRFNQRVIISEGRNVEQESKNGRMKNVFDCLFQMQRAVLLLCWLPLLNHCHAVNPGNGKKLFFCLVYFTITTTVFKRFQTLPSRFAFSLFAS